jgi:hypothetical protein
MIVAFSWHDCGSVKRAIEVEGGLGRHFGHARCWPRNGKNFFHPQKTAREVFSGILNVEKVVIR